TKIKQITDKSREQIRELIEWTSQARPGQGLCLALTPTARRSRQMVEATQSYRERMKAARAEARAKREAEKAARQRELELGHEVRRLAREAVLYSIRAAGDKVHNYTPAEIEREARGLICQWLIAKAKENSAEQNSQHPSNSEVRS